MAKHHQAHAQVVPPPGSSISSQGGNTTTTHIKLPYGDGSNKIFGMENFGNTCYCNSILQCLFYSENFRVNLVKHKLTNHDQKLVVNGVKTHNFTTKYEQLVIKKTKEQGKNPPASMSLSNSMNNSTNTNNGSINNAAMSTTNSTTTVDTNDKPKPSKKGSLFGLKFNTSSSNSSHTLLNNSNYNQNEDLKKFAGYIMEAKNCEALSLDQRLKILRNPDFQQLHLLITRPSHNIANSGQRLDYSQSSSMLLNNEQAGNNPNHIPAPPLSQQQQLQPQQHNLNESVINTTSACVIVGIPHPEPFLSIPINPFNPNPSSDQRKRSALINGPIINLDTSLQLPSEYSDDSALLYALKDMFESMIENKSTIGVVSPTYFISKLKEKNYLFRQNNMHHDAHEFFNYLINEIIECLNKEIGVENNWCNDIFQGLITNETKCLSCETITSKHEFFLDLSIDIPPGESSYSLSYSLNNFSKSETLTNQNKFYCNTCSSLQEAIKTIKLKKLPEVLVINFKRFKYDEKVDKMVKLFDSISYPFKLRLFNTTDDEKDFSLYELYALVIHIGGGPMHGHYISICKIKAGLWLLFDDETVELVEDSYVMRFFGNGPGLASAYILFYSKCTQKPANVDEFDDCINFGFNTNDIYHGDDYSLVDNATTVSDVSGTNAKKSSNTDFSNDESKSEDSSISSTDVQNRKSSITGGGLFKKSFKFEGSSAVANTTSINTSGSTATTISNTNPNANPSTKEDHNLVKTESIKESKEKKTWVGGLKRRESKVDTNMERKAS
ncbi:ubiquitin carboxyl-terminal hydrolase, partial [Scheffersomyces coipomensis]|uniref:ubiquitin carboxyl-terminal hydrolase n=1 Tax=Scheffersomyces coipomensis TaxID=1788519 RepID=UPI00315DA971